MKTHRITYLAGIMDTSICPPAIVYALWPSFDGWPVTLNSTECLVEVPDDAPSPKDLGPLVVVEVLADESAESTGIIGTTVNWIKSLF